MSSSKSEPQAVYRAIYPKALDAIRAAKWIDIETVAHQEFLVSSRKHQSAGFVIALLQPAKTYDVQPPSSWLTDPAKPHHGLYLSALSDIQRVVESSASSTSPLPPTGYGIISSLGPTLAPISPPFYTISSTYCPDFLLFFCLSHYTLVTHSSHTHYPTMPNEFTPQTAHSIARTFFRPPSQVRRNRPGARTSPPARQIGFLFRDFLNRCTIRCWNICSGSIGPGLSVCTIT